MKRTLFVSFVAAWLVVSCGDGSKPATGEPPGTSPGTVDSGASPEWQEIAREPNKRALIGKAVSLGGLRVASAPSKRVFWAGPASGPDYPVILVGAARAAAPDVRAGSVVKITGHVADPTTLDDSALEGLGPRERNRLGNQEICFTADKVEVRP